MIHGGKIMNRAENSIIMVVKRMRNKKVIKQGVYSGPISPPIRIQESAISRRIQICARLDSTILAG